MPVYKLKFTCRNPEVLFPNTHSAPSPRCCCTLPSPLPPRCSHTMYRTPPQRLSLKAGAPSSHHLPTTRGTHPKQRREPVSLRSDCMAPRPHSRTDVFLSFVPSPMHRRGCKGLSEEHGAPPARGAGSSVLRVPNTLPLILIPNNTYNFVLGSFLVQFQKFTEG